MRPSNVVRAAFGVAGAARQLATGQGTAWKVGDTVLKPLDVLHEEKSWSDEVARNVDLAGSIRLSLPLRSKTQELVVDGWTAFPYLAVQHLPERWMDAAVVARKFAELFCHVQRPPFIDMRMHAWARADRFAWGEDDRRNPITAPRAAELVNARKHFSAPAGIIHGDMTGNVLFDPAEPPAVIDLTVYWRPAEYSVAVIAVDAVCFESAPLSLLETISSDEHFPQYLIRALLFRMATDSFNRRPQTGYGAYTEVVDRVLKLVAGEERRLIG